MHLRKWAHGACLVLLAAASACANWGTAASLRGVPVPVMLGPVDRVGGGASPTLTKVREYGGESTRQFTQGSYSTTSGNMVTTARWTEESETGSNPMIARANRATGGGGEAIDIRVTKLKAKNYIVFFGTSTKAYVEVEGDVVRRGALP